MLTNSIFEKKAEINQVKIRAYIDFDGTLSTTSGKDTVDRASYKSLIQRGSFPKCAFKKESMMVAILQKQTDLKLAEGALKFLYTLLELNAEIFIVSKNLKEYIEASLLAAGMPKEKLFKIDIQDRRCGSVSKSFKYNIVSMFEKELKDKANITIICDDEKSSHDDMVRAARENGCQNILDFNAKPGTFQFDEMMKKIKAEAKGNAFLTTTTNSSNLYQPLTRNHTQNNPADEKLDTQEKKLR